MLKDLVEKSWLSADDILTQVQDEFKRGKGYATNIRRAFRKEDKLFINQKKKKEKLGDFTYYAVYAALMARSYVNSPEAFFEETVGNKWIASKLNNIVKQDFEETDMQVLKYYRDSNKYKRWVGIIAKKGWDGDEKRGIFDNISTELWIPDPDGDYSKNEYSFTWFQDAMYKNQIKSLSDREKIDFDVLNDKISDEWKKRKKQTDSENKWTSYTGSKNRTHNNYYDVYYHFSYFDGIPAMVLTANDNHQILKVKILEAVTEWEKKDPSTIKFPFAFTYWVPDGTPFGMRLPTFVEDSQKAKAIMNNLRLDKEMAELYPTYIRDSNILPNKWDITFWFNKIIDANPLQWQSAANALTPIAKDFRSDNSFAIEQSIDRWVSSTTSIDKIAQWSLPNRRETAQTNNLVQNNTDVNLAIAELVESWGEKQLLRLIIRAYQEHFTDGDTKHISMKTSYWLMWVPLKKKDFLSSAAIKIKVITKTESNKKKQEQRNAMWVAIGMIQTLPITESAKKFLYREYFEIIWLDKEKAERIADYTPEEVIAMINAELISNWILVEVKPEYDAMVHLAALKSCPPSAQKELYKSWLLKLYQIKWTQAQEPEGNEALKSNIAAQAWATVANENTSINNPDQTWAL